ncbi:MAG: RagB/SusD family nutrient uptake outer membrane protein [Gemmatimonadetes bacterium]|nr:RagB/SusD family nutrient uptake outer membrane protein [Gemmatimonadota bacterium]
MRVQAERNEGTCARARAPAGFLAILALAASACNFDVTNPGPAQDAVLDRAESHQAIVVGANRLYNDAFNLTTILSAAHAREVFPSGNTGYKAIGEFNRRGLMPYDDGKASGQSWDPVQNARWVAEAGVERFRRVLKTDFAKSAVAGQSLLWAGLSSRLAGEHFCEAVLDGGPIQPRTAFFERAEKQFTEAIQVARAAGKKDIELAAVGGRASVRMSLGKWADAVADAGQVPLSFKYQTKFSDADIDQKLSFAFLISSAPWRAFTVWNTFYLDYYTQTGDPRTPWEKHPTQDLGDSGVGDWGKVPFRMQRKYTKTDDAVDLVDGREMRLIIAESYLVKGEWQQAMQITNELRTSLISRKTGKPLEPWQASNVEEAWTAFFKERGIELWLEGRRMGDRQRWKDTKAPGKLTVWEVSSTTEPVHERGRGTYLDPNFVLCFPVPRSERITNPNVPDLP